MKERYVNECFYVLFLFTLTFGVMFYNLIIKVTGFAYTDEICALAVFALFGAYLFGTKDWEMNKAFLVTLAVFAFYVVYSILIGSSSMGGIATDLFINVKPFTAFFCAYAIAPVLSGRQKKMASDMAFVFWLMLVAIGAISLVYPRIIRMIMSHESYFGSAVACVSLCRFYFSGLTRRDRVMLIVMLSAGLFSGRAKFYGFYAMALFMVIFFANIKSFKFNLRNTVILAAMFAVMAVVAWQKLNLYFFQMTGGDAETDMAARYALYVTAPFIMIDFFPFGSGFASFATFASGAYYSNIYVDYGLDEIWGLSRSYYSFVADTYYPSLAQFGVAGLVLYVVFWVYVVRRAIYYFRGTGDLHSLIVIILITGYLAIESIANATFTANPGLFVMLLAGVALSGMKNAAFSDNEQKLEQ
jgi:hypothetical protein